MQQSIYSQKKLIIVLLTLNNSKTYFSDFKQAKKVGGCLTNFEQVKKINGYFADLKIIFTKFLFVFI